MASPILRAMSAFAGFGASSTRTPSYQSPRRRGHGLKFNGNCTPLFSRRLAASAIRHRWQCQQSSSSPSGARHRTQVSENSGAGSNGSPVIGLIVAPGFGLQASLSRSNSSSKNKMSPTDFRDWVFDKANRATRGLRYRVGTHADVEDNECQTPSRRTPKWISRHSDLVRTVVEKRTRESSTGSGTYQ